MGEDSVIVPLQHYTPEQRGRMLEDIYRRMVAGKTGKWEANAEAEIEALEAEGLSTPLWAMIRGALGAVADAEGKPRGKVEGEAMLLALFEEEWRKAEELDKNDAPQMAFAVAATAMAGGQTLRGLGQLNLGNTGLDVSRLPTVLTEDAKAMFGWLARWEGDMLLPAEPDLLAEAFVLYTLSGKLERRQPQLKDTLVAFLNAEAAKAGQDETHFIWDFAARALQRFPALASDVLQPALPEGSEAEWRTIAFATISNPGVDAETLKRRTDRAIAQPVGRVWWMRALADLNPKQPALAFELGQRLHAAPAHPYPSELRTAYAMLLFNSIIDAPTRDRRNTVLDELRQIARRHDEAALRKFFAKGLVNALATDLPWGHVFPLLTELRQLTLNHDEEVLRECLVMGLVNALHDAPDWDQKSGFLDELRAVVRKHSVAALRDRYAHGLVIAFTSAPTWDEKLLILDELRHIAIQYGEAVLREKLALVLFNAFNNAPTLKRKATLLDELRQLSRQHKEPSLREFFSSGLFNAFNEAQTERQQAKVLKELRQLAHQHNEPAVRNNLARALVNASAFAPTWELRVQLLEELRSLAYGQGEPAILESYAKGLFNAVVGAQTEERKAKFLNDLRQLERAHDLRPVRAWFAKGLFNALFDERTEERKDELLDELRELARQHYEADVRETLAKALANAFTAAPRKELKEGLVDELLETTANPASSEMMALRVHALHLGLRHGKFVGSSRVRALEELLSYEDLLPDSQAGQMARQIIQQLKRAPSAPSGPEIPEPKDWNGRTGQEFPSFL